MEDWISHPCVWIEAGKETSHKFQHNTVQQLGIEIIVSQLLSDEIPNFRLDRARAVRPSRAPNDAERHDAEAEAATSDTPHFTGTPRLSAEVVMQG